MTTPLVSPERRRERAGAEPWVLRRGDDGYPDSLAELAQPPDTLWGIGDAALMDHLCVSIVGTRRASAYGERITRELAGALARAGACIVSGMARGIDGAAHEAALAAGAPTIAVLGTGVDIAYPAGHRQMRRRIAEQGLLLSELPPGMRSDGWAFPRRNRIIAALSKLTIVIEAGEKSGALGTARHALELHRELAAVPGPIDSPQSVGSNRLLHAGAQIILSVEDALALVGATRPVRSQPLLQSDAESRLWAVLGDGPGDLDALCARAGLRVVDALQAVTALELRGAVECELTGQIRRR